MTCYSVIGHPPNDLVESHSNAEDNSSNNVTAEGDTDNSRVHTMENAEEPTTTSVKQSKKMKKVNELNSSHSMTMRSQKPPKKRKATSPTFKVGKKHKNKRRSK